MVWLIKNKNGNIVFNCSDYATCRDYWLVLCDVDPDQKYYIDYAWDL